MQAARVTTTPHWTARASSSFPVHLLLRVRRHRTQGKLHLPLHLPPLQSRFLGLGRARRIRSALLRDLQITVSVCSLSLRCFRSTAVVWSILPPSWWLAFCASGIVIRVVVAPRPRRRFVCMWFRFFLVNGRVGAVNALCALRTVINFSGIEKS